MSLRRKILLPMTVTALALLVYLQWGPLQLLDESQRAGVVAATSLGLLLMLSVGALAVEFRLRKPLTALLQSVAPASAVPSAVGRSALRGDELQRCAQAIIARDRRIEQLEAEMVRARAEQSGAEAELRVTEERYVMAVRGAYDGLWEWNLRNDTMYLSPRWKGLLGYGDEELTSDRNNWRQRVLPEDLAGVDAALAAHLAGSTERYEHEHRLLHREGKVIWVLSRGRAVRHANGSPFRVVGLDTDITRVKRVESILFEIAEGTAGTTGSEFFAAMVRHFAAALRVPLAFVTECADHPVSRLRTLAFWADGGFRDNFEYDLPGTPCEAVVTQAETCFLPQRTGELFPRERGYEGYLGIPIIGSKGDVLGHLAFLSVAPMHEDMLVDSIYRIFTARAAAEIERLLALAELHGLRGGTTALPVSS